MDKYFTSNFVTFHFKVNEKSEDEFVGFCSYTNNLFAKRGNVIALDYEMIFSNMRLNKM